MGQRATDINLTDRRLIIVGEPILDTDDGVLVIQYEDGTSRTFNWAYVLDFYYMTEEETKQLHLETEEEPEDE